MNTHRAAYLKMAKENSISIFYAGLAPHKSADSFYPFVCNKNFYYLSGIEQEGSILVLVKAKEEKALLFIDEPSELKALWDGEMLSYEKAALISGIEVKNVFKKQDFEAFLSNIFSQSRRALFTGISEVYFDFERLNSEHEPLLGERNALSFQQKYPFVNMNNASVLLTKLRSVKDQTEIDKIKQAVKISHLASNHILKTLKNAKNEACIEAEFNYVLHKNHAKPSFDSIIAAGANATVLHYVKNNSELNKNDLVLIDAGALLDHYASDITRTYPLSGKFSKRQKEIYQAVLNVNQAVIKWVKAGITQREYNEYGKQLLIKEAKKLKLIKEDDEITKYYYHGLGHALGLDIHDVCDVEQPFKVGQVLTVEPGLYVKEEGIGVRIEDNIVLTKDGCINLSSDIIKEVEEIEKALK